MKRMMIAGWYGMQNTGDDALMAVTAWGAREFMNADRLSATSSSIPAFQGSGKVTPVMVDVQRFKGENRLRMYCEAFRSNGIIFGGGSVFHSSEDMRLKIDLLRLAGKGPHAAVGVAIGPFRDAEAEKVCAQLLKRLDFVGLRDKESLQIARAIAPGVHSEKTFDLAPLLPRVGGLVSDGSRGEVPRKGLGISLCHYERFINGNLQREEDRKRKLLQVFDMLDPSSVGEVVFIDFNGHDFYGDRKLHNEIISNISKRFQVRHIPYSSNPLETLELIKSLRAIVAMRLHAAVFGYLAETPAIILSYHPKCLEWGREIGLSKGQVFDSCEFDPSTLACCINNSLNGDIEQPALTVAEAERAAMKNWEWGL